MATPSLILHVWKGCTGRQGHLSFAAPFSVRGDFEVTSSAFVTKHQGSKPRPELVPQYQSPRCHAVSFMASVVTDCSLLHVLLCRSEREEKRNGNERETDIEKERR